MVYHWLPNSCLLCRRPCAEHSLCSDCLATLAHSGHACRVCGLGLPDSAGVEVCGPCQRRRLPVQRFVAAYDYEGAVRDLVAALKFHADFAAGRFLGEELASAVRERYARAGDVLPEMLIPVPLHASRLRQRGFNQSQLLAQALATRLRLTMDLVTVQRGLPTADQIGLRALARRRNLRGAFQVSAVAAVHIAIIDDVVTTGATVLELARSLHRAGVERIDVWCVARTAARR